MLLCNKLVPKRFHPHPRLLAEVRECYFPRHRSGNVRSIGERELEDRQTVCRECRAVIAAASLRLPRLRIVVRKLKIAPRGAVPFGHGEIVLIQGL
jgi:hypothetical protein